MSKYKTGDLLNLKVGRHRPLHTDYYARRIIEGINTPKPAKTGFHHIHALSSVNWHQCIGGRNAELAGTTYIYERQKKKNEDLFSQTPCYLDSKFRSEELLLTYASRVSPPSPSLPPGTVFIPRVRVHSLRSCFTFSP